MEAGESSAATAAAVAMRLGSDSVLCVAGAPNARHSSSAPRFYSLPMVPFLALLLELHIIEVFVLCGRLRCAASTLGECSVAAECGTTWILLVLPPRLHSRPSLIHCFGCVGAFFFFFLKVWLKGMTLLVTPSLWYRVGKDCQWWLNVSWKLNTWGLTEWYLSEGLLLI